MKYIGVIPARYASTRFPGKPLASLCGRSLIQHVYDAASKFPYWDDLVVATDSEEILSHCRRAGISALMTRSDHPDCIDRAAEVASQIDGEKYIIIQGDEPFFDASMLDADLSPDVVNFYTEVTHESEICDPNVVKAIVSKSLRAIYFSRHTIPYCLKTTQKSHDYINIDKQVGVYSFSRDNLLQFSSLGMSFLEGVEGIGLLRLLENDITVHMRYCVYDPISVDTPEDLFRAEQSMEEA